MANQLPLNLVRPRRALKRKEEVRLRVPRRVASAVAKASDADVATAAAVGLRALMDSMCTSWEVKEPPPGPGLWQVTDHKTGTLLELWWWSGVYWVQGTDPGAAPQRTLHGMVFPHEYAWRGLKDKPVSAYDCPPYTSQTVPKGCRLGNRKPPQVPEYPEPAFKSD